MDNQIDTDLSPGVKSIELDNAVSSTFGNPFNKHPLLKRSFSLTLKSNSLSKCVEVNTEVRPEFLLQMIKSKSGNTLSSTTENELLAILDGSKESKFIYNTKDENLTNETSNINKENDDAPKYTFECKAQIDKIQNSSISDYESYTLTTKQELINKNNVISENEFDDDQNIVNTDNDGDQECSKLKIIINCDKSFQKKEIEVSDDKCGKVTNENSSNLNSNDKVCDIIDKDHNIHNLSELHCKPETRNLHSYNDKTSTTWEINELEKHNFENKTLPEDVEEIHFENKSIKKDNLTFNQTKDDNDFKILKENTIILKQKLQEEKSEKSKLRAKARYLIKSTEIEKKTNKTNQSGKNETDRKRNRKDNNLRKEKVKVKEKKTENKKHREHSLYHSGLHRSSNINSDKLDGPDTEKFKVGLSIGQWPNRGPVYHKIDGQRFAHTNTLKVRANHRYVISATVSPAKQIM